MILDNWDHLLRIVALSTLGYFTLLVVLRISGKRTLSKLNIFGVATTVAFGSVLATTQLNSDVALAEGAAAMIMLAFLQWLIAALSLRIGWFKMLIRSKPRLLFCDGKFLEKGMAKERISRDEIEAAVRANGCGSLTDIGAVILETDGSISVVPTARLGDRSALQGLEPEA